MNIGVDILEHSRISRLLEDESDPFWHKVYSPAELREATGRTDRVSYLAGRFAAKEAVMKCLESLRGLKESDIEIMTGENGAPYVKIRGERSGIKISISHDTGYSVAFALNSEDNL